MRRPLPLPGLHGPLIRLELSPPGEWRASFLEWPFRRRELLSVTIRSRHVVRQPPNALQVAVGKPEIHQVPRVFLVEPAIPQKRFEQLMGQTTPPMGA